MRVAKLALTAALATTVALLVGGCASEPAPGPSAEALEQQQMFAPVTMRIHPIFTQIKDWTGDDDPDGVEVLLEFKDQFGDPTKTTGTVLFELYAFRRASAEPRGERVVNPWVASLQTVQQQGEHWNRTSRTYSFQLAWPQIRTDRPYVLTAIFERSGGGRFFDRMILEPPREAREPAAATKENGLAPAPKSPEPSGHAPTTRTPQP